MITMIGGFLTLGYVLWMSISSDHDHTLMNVHSITIVGIGTIGVFLLSTPPSTLVALIHVLTGKYRSNAKIRQVHAALSELTKSKAAKVGKVHPLISRATELWDQGVEPALFELLLEQRAEAMDQSSAKAVTAIKNLAKYPPAMGMTGTVMGLVNLFSQLTPEKKGQIGPNLAMAMTATFYGLVLSNMVIMPLGDRAHVKHMEEARVTEHILKALLLIHRGEPRSVVEGEMRGYAA